MKNKFDINKISKKDEFKVPDGYFENLHQSVEDKIKSEGLKVDDSTKVISLIKKKRNWLIYSGIAACLAVGLFVIFQNQIEECQTFACLLENTEITDEDIEIMEVQESGDIFEDENNDEYLF